MRSRRSPRSRFRFVFRHQRKGKGPAHIEGQLDAGVGDARGKTFLVNGPQLLEIVLAEVADAEGHPAIVAACEMLGRGSGREALIRAGELPAQPRGGTLAPQK